MNYGFHPAAEAEYLEQVAYYESCEPGLGARYLEHFQKALHRICDAPGQYAIARAPNVRRFQLRTFPLTVIYREQNGEIQVLAVAHYRRRPGYWLSRVSLRTP
jgi:toxin ParE1/3/4